MRSAESRTEESRGDVQKVRASEEKSVSFWPIELFVEDECFRYKR